MLKTEMQKPFGPIRNLFVCFQLRNIGEIGDRFFFSWKHELSSIREDQKPTVIIKCGKIVGKIKETQNELEDFIAFTSIPYAEPPIGKWFF